MLILLDIDGVMVPAKSWSAPPLLDDGFYKFSESASKALNGIIQPSNASILLTTSHKSRYSEDTWKKMFQRRGIIVNKLEKLPTCQHQSNRLEEIKTWFSTNRSVDDFVIIDDDKSLNDLPSDLKKRLVLTKPLIGLTSQNIQESLDILNTPLELA